MTSIEIARHTLLSCGVVLAIGTLAAFLAQKIRVPDVAVFMIAGIAIGPQALGLIHVPADSALNEIIVLFGASYILFDGGASLRLRVLKQVWITIVVIATMGVVDHRRRSRRSPPISSSAFPSSWRCCSARRSPRPIRRR